MSAAWRAADRGSTSTTASRRSRRGEEPRVVRMALDFGSPSSSDFRCCRVLTPFVSAGICSPTVRAEAKSESVSLGSLSPFKIHYLRFLVDAAWLGQLCRVTSQPSGTGGQSTSGTGVTAITRSEWQVSQYGSYPSYPETNYYFAAGCCPRDRCAQSLGRGVAPILILFTNDRSQPRSYPRLCQRVHPHKFEPRVLPPEHNNVRLVREFHHVRHRAP